MLTPGTLPSRLVAVLLLLLLLLAAWQFALAPLLELYRGNQDTIQRHADLLQRYEALAASEPALAAELEDRKAAGEASTGYLDGPSDALAAAQLQDRIKETIESVGGEVRRVCLQHHLWHKRRKRFHPYVRSNNG
jgi:general secretion pathway protein M